MAEEEAESPTGVTAPDVEQEGSLPSLSSLPDLDNTDSQKPIELVPPSSALPEVLTDLDVSEVAAPSEVSVPSNTEDVLPPEGASVPSLGASPSEGSLDVVPPSGIAGVVPPIDSEVTPIDAVVPPIGWEGEGEVTTTSNSIEDFNACGWDYLTNEDARKCLADREIAEQERRQLAELEKSLGEKGITPDQKAGRALLYDVAKTYGSFSEEALALMIINNVSQNRDTFSPRERLNMYIRLGHLINQGEEGLDAIKQISAIVSLSRRLDDPNMTATKLKQFTQYASYDMRQSHFIQVLETFDHFPDPRMPASEQSIEEHVATWLTAGVLVDTYTGARFSFLEKAFEFDSNFKGSNVAFNKAGAKLAHHSGNIAAGALAAYSLHQVMNDPDYDYLPVAWKLAYSLTGSAVSYAGGLAGTAACSPTTVGAPFCAVALGSGGSLVFGKGYEILVDSISEQISDHPVRDPILPSLYTP